MMKKTTLLTCLLAALMLPACGYIKSLFPDKEKDYQYTTEIPALVLPADLGAQDILKPPPTTMANPAAGTVVEAIAAPVAVKPAPATVSTTTITDAPAVVDIPVNNADDSPAETQTPAAKHEFIPVERIDAAEGSRLRLGVAFDKAWRTIDKALSRKSIEVTSRNKQDNTFALHYDPNEKKLEDGSLWSEALFIFSGFQGDEQEFLIKLIDGSKGNSPQTDVIVLDKAAQPTTDPSALHLLELLQETIKTDFAK
ncbi:MAG: outer membrane protein assembly factor BamC [Methylovulum sp.]|nr:outer membrane protein assembly factor BamC [Methylovulum sp.]